MLNSNHGFVLAPKRSNNVTITIFFAIWFVMLSLRHISCGNDLWNYERMFFEVGRLDFWEAINYSGIEQLYWGFNWFMAQIYSDFRPIIVIIAFLCTGITGWFYWKESEIPILTLLLFVTNVCYKMFYSGLRQSIAMLFTIPAYYFTKKKRIIPFVLMVILAMFFHESAIILFLLYPIFHIPLSSKNFVEVLLLLALFFLFKEQIFLWIVPFLADKWSHASITETNGYSVYIFFLSFIIFSFLVCDEKKLTPDIRGLRNILVLMTVLQSFVSIHPLAMRMNYYFVMLFPIIIPKLLNRPKIGLENVARFVGFGLVVYLLYFFLFVECSMDRAGLRIYPYKAFWM